MTELKKLSSKVTNPNRLTFSDGFMLGLGFWAASFVILPLLSCGAFVVLSILGISLGGLLSGGR